MGRATLAEKLALLWLVVTSSACVSDHRVSPWGGGAPPPISAFAAPSDLEAQLGAIDAETRALGLRKTLELRGELPGGGPVIARGYEKTDASGRTAHAVRAATAHGVVLAIGPFEEPEAGERHAELVPALAPDATSTEDEVTRQLTDLNGDSLPDAVLRSRRGALEIHRIGPLGSSRYAVRMAVIPSELTDADGDGRLDLSGRASVPADDPLAPALVDVATFEDGRYTNASAGARAFHAHRASPDAASARAKTPPSPPDDATRLRGVIERAWHAILAGNPRARVLEALSAEPVPASLRASFDRHRARIEALSGAEPAR